MTKQMIRGINLNMHVHVKLITAREHSANKLPVSRSFTKTSQFRLKEHPTKKVWYILF